MAKKHQPGPASNLPEDLICIEKARALTLKWAKTQKINLLRIELVTGNILTDKVFAVWLFFDIDNRLKEYEANGTLQKIKDKYSDSLKELSCPREYLQGIIFFEDTDENAARYTNLKPIKVG